MLYLTYSAFLVEWQAQASSKNIRSLIINIFVKCLTISYSII